MLTRNEKKTYKSLSSAKGRRETGLFMAQGTKCVLDTLPYFEVSRIIATHHWSQLHPDINLEIAKPEDIASITTLADAPEVIAIYRIPQVVPASVPPHGLTLALDCIQDPGNLGTIIRVCDWMGIDCILASNDTVDVWSPKVVQSTMGAISRVKVSYCDLPQILSKCADLPIYGTFLEGENIYHANLQQDAVIVMGNEGKGISAEVSACLTDKITIPSFPQGRITSESLNVAVATAITLSEFRRNG